MESSLPFYVFPINSKPFGLSYSDWSIRWWQWICSIPKNQNPAFDFTGEFAYNNQRTSDVTFLCQTIEGKEKIPNRISGLSSSSFFFMPVINWISVFGIDGFSDKELEQIAKEKMNVIDKLEIQINEIYLGSILKENRVLSSFFDVYLPEDNIFDVEKGKRRCISDGYWIFFKNVANSVFISSRSACSAGITQIGVEYQLTRSDNKTT
jgi:hypothetical protein